MITKQEIEELIKELNQFDASEENALQNHRRNVISQQRALEALNLALSADLWKAEAERWRKVAENQDGGTYVRVIQERDNWRHDCEQMSRDTSYYRDLIYRVGKLLGEEVKICDDGVNCGEILVDKVPEVAQKTLFQYGEFTREVASALGLSNYAFNLKETVEYLRKRLHDVEQVDKLRAEVANLSLACKSRDIVIEDKNRHIQDLEAEAKRLHDLWHSCEVVINEAASIIGACARDPKGTLVAACQRVSNQIRSLKSFAAQL